jgi:ATP-binding protein involved in chromosome partitioning
MGFKVGVLDADIYGPSMPIMFDVENENQYRLPLTENQNETSRKLRDKNSFYWIFYITISSCDLERTNGLKSVEPNDFDADWEN